MLLAIDTATRIMSLALHDGFNLRAEQTWHTANNHTAELAPTIRDLLHRAEFSLNDLTSIAVSIGPGSYTGLRIGVALAKGLAAVRGLPLIGVSTLDTLAVAQPYYQGSALITLVDAGRGRIITATYRWKKGEWAARGEAQLMDWPTLIESIDGPAYLAGDVDADGLAALQAAQAQDIPLQLIPAASRLRRAGFLADEALKRLNTQGKDAFPAAHLMPLYVQTKDVP